MKNLAIFTLLSLTACSAQAPINLTAQTPCPNAPNCVSTYSQKEQHRIEPYTLHRIEPYTLHPNSSWKSFTAHIQKMKNVKILKKSANTLHTVFTTDILHFQDDVIFQKENNTIHFRSASRLGYHDLGKNRSRMEDLQKKLQKATIIK